MTKLLAENESIESLDVRNNYINLDIIEAIERSLHDNVRLQELLLFGEGQELDTKKQQKILWEIMINTQIVELNKGKHIHDYLYKQSNGVYDQIRMIDLQGCTLTELDGQAILKLCRKDKTIQALDLSRTELSDSLLTPVLEMIKSGQGSI